MDEQRDSDRITIRIRRSHLYLLVGLLVGFGAGLLVTQATGSRTTTSAGADGASGSPPAAIVDVDTEGRPSRGPEDAPVTVVEFTDYECPFCARHFRETYRPLLSKYEGRLNYVTRNFPIPQLHPLAQKAAEAAECAHEQGRFWEYHDLLFERSPLLGPDSLRAYAGTTGLDTAEFEECLTSGRMAGIVAQDVQDGFAYGVTGTPTFFVNGKRLVGTFPLTDFSSHIDEALEQVDASDSDG